jgi:hypothetical protein
MVRDFAGYPEHESVQLLPHMQTLNSAAIAARNTRANALGLNPRDYLGLGRFSLAADKAGLKSTGITKGPLGQGALLKLSGAEHNYEVLVDGAGNALLGRVEKDGSKRVRLCSIGTNSEAGWEKLIEALKAGEGRLA